MKDDIITILHNGFNDLDKNELEMLGDDVQESPIEEEFLNSLSPKQLEMLNTLNEFYEKESIKKEKALILFMLNCFEPFINKNVE